MVLTQNLEVLHMQDMHGLPKQ